MKAWKDYNIGDLCSIKHGWAFQGEYFSNEGNFILLTPGNFFEQGGFRQQEGKEKFYTGKFPKDYLLKENDIVIAMTEQGAGLLGSPALVPRNNRYLHNQRLGLLYDFNNELVVDKYLYYLFFTKNVRQEIAASATGTKVKHTAPKRIYSIKINLPSLSTQSKIISIISAYDDLIENNLQRIKLLEETAQITFNDWFGKITYLPKGWERNKLTEIAEFINGYAFKPRDLKKEGLPIIKIKELKKWICPTFLVFINYSVCLVRLETKIHLVWLTLTAGNKPFAVIGAGSWSNQQQLIIVLPQPLSADEKIFLFWNRAICNT